MSPEFSTTYSTPDGLVQIVSRGAQRRGRTHEMHHQFLVDNNVELAAAAFEGFTRHGAGAVILWRDARPRRFRPRPFEPERLWYSTQLHVLPTAAEATFDGWEAEQIEMYDPQLESVVVFVEKGRFSAYRMRGSIAPPDSHRNARAVLN